MGNISDHLVAGNRPGLLTRFRHWEPAGGVLLMLSALAALIVANTSLYPFYALALQTSVLGMSIEHWINDALMAIFFLMVGLEIKREILAGQLSTWSQRALPGFAAIGGMVVPALIYIWINRGSPDTMAGWAIPAATDIAFALGVLSLLGRRVPVSLKIFLSALAILDDLGAVAIIAIFYTSDLNTTMLLTSGTIIAALAVMNRAGVNRLIPYIVVGAVLWVLVLKSGVHATLAGVALAFCIPLNKGSVEKHSPLLKMEHGLSPWVAFLILPVFGFANAGVSLAGVSADNLLDPIPLGIALGLLIGKQVGIFTLAVLAIKTGLARMPVGSTWVQVYGISLLCAIGFTMSLFIGGLAFPEAPHLINEVKVGVLAGSILAAIAGVFVLRLGSLSKT
jgi:NhaA family Na+:H+ antiporter